MKFPVAKFLKPSCLSLGLVLAASAAEASLGWSLLPAVQVDATGIYLDQIVAGATSDVPHLRLAPAPISGRLTLLTPPQVNDLLQKAAPELVTTNWSGAAQIKISRKTRLFTEGDLNTLLTSTLQKDYVQDRGELELRFTRPFTTVTVVDEPLSVQLLDVPTAGVTANFIARFELRAGDEVVGTWQIPTQARIWRDIYVAGNNLKRGQLIRDVEINRERRDLLTVRDALTDLELDNAGLELAENIAAGMPLSSRSVRLRAIIHRGRMADAIVSDGLMTLSVKVEVLEDGLPGQTIRVRNLKSKKEFRGKVQNEETIYVAL